jgi:hypothetical protein
VVTSETNINQLLYSSQDYLDKKEETIYYAGLHDLRTYLIDIKKAINERNGYSLIFDIMYYAKLLPQSQLLKDEKKVEEGDDNSYRYVHKTLDTFYNRYPSLNPKEIQKAQEICKVDYKYSYDIYLEDEDFQVENNSYEETIYNRIRELSTQFKFPS